MELDLIQTVARDGILAVCLVLNMFYLGAKIDKLAAALYRHEGRGRDMEDR